MPLQNRVNPFGNLFRTTARGIMMGNRGGAIHNEDREIVRRYKSRRWIACVLEFRGRHRIVMSPNRYTELFFLDEATAFAAGHRPCAECRRERYNAFRAAWHTPAFADDIDRELHPARIGPHKEKVTYEAELHTLPDGTFADREGSAWLIKANELLRWTPEGYTERIARSTSERVTVLTPKPIVECFRRGYKTAIHDSAR
jgi:hypothetical protein